MEVLTAQGKILYVGSSNFAGWHIAQAKRRPPRRNFLGLVSEQSIYNLLTRDVELEVAAGGASTTASASSRGARCTAACSAACCARRGRACAAARVARRTR